MLDHSLPQSPRCFWLVVDLNHRLGLSCSKAVQRLDNAIHRINHYPADNLVCFLTLIHWIAIYPVVSFIQPLNNWGQEELGVWGRE